ncbi:MAG: class I SAM-dependent methyltransferase [Myxococcales bacterium]
MSAYDPVAVLYDRAFEDIRVRRAEWRWVQRRLQAFQAPPRALEIGCGTGALLRALTPSLSCGVGLDVSGPMLEQARQRARHLPTLSFVQIEGPALPVPDASHDLVISFLSFRYLDWPAIWPEIRRVLAPGGRFWMVDMVASKPAPGDLPLLARAGVRKVLAPLRTPRLARDLKALTRHPEWQTMLAQHPARPLSEYQAFFSRTLPGRSLRTLDVSPSRRVIAIDSGALR